jgi:copper chaperone
MAKTVIKVEGMSCEHCVKAVHGALTALPGVSDAAVDLDAGTATVEYDDALVGIAEFTEAIEEEGYDVA